MFDKGLLSKHKRTTTQYQKKKKKDLKMGKRPEYAFFSKEGIEMANRHEKIALDVLREKSPT